MRLTAGLAVSVSLSMLAAQPERPALHSVTAIRHWSMADVTRVAIEVSGNFHFVTERLHNPERVYYDIPDARPRVDGKRLYSKDIQDKLLKRLRVAETLPNVTRIVLDLGGSVEATASQLTNPDRLIVELRSVPGGISTASAAAVSAAEPPVVRPVVGPLIAPAAIARTLPPVPEAPKPQPPKVETPKPSPKVEVAKVDASRSEGMAPEPPKTEPVTAVKPAVKPDLPEPAAVEPSTRQLSKVPEKPASAPDLPRVPVASATETPSTMAPLPPGEIGKAAHHTASGETSLVRALGLKVARVVIDPGHGGHDQGTQGAHGLIEKEVVLDVAKRLGKMIEDRMGAEVIFTRSDDTFIPLEGRTAMANEKKADLFLSIHANSSPATRISGTETYFLNFTDASDALDVASRENASSQKSIFELRDIISKITLHDKAEESKDFAGKLQTSLYSLSAKNFPGTKNRGVKKAPFVVLIGASMPSVLAEIGFLSNQREEALLKRPDYRQKLAEALFHGVKAYADSLSHFQVAQAQK